MNTPPKPAEGEESGEKTEGTKNDSDFY